MKTYTDIRTTPLKFHKFFWKIWIPLNIILGGWNLGTTLVNMQQLDFYYAIDIFYYFTSAVLFAFVFSGFFRWKRNALVALFLQMAVNIVYVMVLYVLFSQKMPGNASLANGTLVGTLLRCLAIGIYYYNRRKLFVKGGYTNQQLAQIFGSSQNNSFAGSFVNSQTPLQNMQNAESHFCHNCGKQLTNNPNFCIYCGTKLK